MTGPHPLRFEPILLEKVWGGRRLERWGKILPPHVLVGESWEIADLASTDASGAGGGERRSVVAAGPLTGRTLGEVVGLWGPVLLGRDRARAGAFPLLVKLLDAREHLSVQVHPSPEYAAANPGAHLKTEAWYVLEAEPGAVIYKGLREGVTPDELRRRIEAGTLVDALVAVDAIPGELHNLPSGTLHALGAGVLVAEVQTPSDTTFRLYDWSAEYGRTGRSLHLEQALACIDFGPAPGAVRLAEGEQTGRLLATEYFTIDEARLPPGEELIVGEDDRPSILICIAGAGVVASALLAFEDVSIRRGETLLLPAALGADVVARAGAGGLSLLRAGLP
ncbi:MAG: type I phosphomannose isomerase catalytic subunit [Phycisphaerales bacterium JB039]